MQGRALGWRASTRPHRMLTPFSPLSLVASQDSSGKLTNDYWSKLQSRLKIESDGEEENDENKKEEDKIHEKFEASLANKEVVVEEQSL